MKGKKPLIALVALLFVGVVGVTFAYFTETETFQNIFKTVLKTLVLMVESIIQSMLLI